MAPTWAGPGLLKGPPAVKELTARLELHKSRHPKRPQLPSMKHDQ